MPIIPPPPPIAPNGLTLSGDGGTNILTGSTLDDYLQGLGGNDGLTGAQGHDYLDGGDGRDTLSAGSGDDTLLGGAGDDWLYGNSGNNQLFGGDGSDRLFSGTKASVLVGGEGDDILQARIDVTQSDHTLEGGAGADLFEVIGAAAANQATLFLTDFDTTDDSLTVDGTSVATVINQGAYLVRSGVGLRYTLQSGDILHFDGLNAEDMFRAYGLAGSDTIIGDGLDETLFGGAGNNNLDGANGNDVITALGGNDTMYGGNGDDTLGGKNGDDWLFGGDGADVIYGNAGQDRLYGEDGDDWLYSSTQNSTLSGGAGDDLLSARMDKGADHSLTGGAGDDTFDFTHLVTNRDSDNVITDFTLDEDMATIAGQTIFAYAADNGLWFDDADGDALFALQGGSSIRFAGVDAAILNEMIWPVIGDTH